jgi:hypothetical protein
METSTPTVSRLEPLLTIEELAEYLDVPVATIYDWRVDGKGPCAIRRRSAATSAIPADMSPDHDSTSARSLHARSLLKGELHHRDPRAALVSPERYLPGEVVRATQGPRGSSGSQDGVRGPDACEPLRRSTRRNPCRDIERGTAMTPMYAFLSILFAALAVGIPLVGVRLIEHKLR